MIPNRKKNQILANYSSYRFGDISGGGECMQVYRPISKFAALKSSSSPETPNIIFFLFELQWKVPRGLSETKLFHYLIYKKVRYSTPKSRLSGKMLPDPEDFPGLRSWINFLHKKLETKYINLPCSVYELMTNPSYTWTSTVYTCTDKEYMH